MKLLMIYTSRFAWTPGQKTLKEVPDCSEGRSLEQALVGLVHAEAADIDDPKKIETKLVKNLKWGARKNDTQRIVMHTFSHLAETKATPEFTQALLARAEERLVGAGYEVCQTPFGYFLDLDLAAPGVSQARIFTSF